MNKCSFSISLFILALCFGGCQSEDNSSEEKPEVDSKYPELPGEFCSEVESYGEDTIAVFVRKDTFVRFGMMVKGEYFYQADMVSYNSYRDTGKHGEIIKVDSLGEPISQKYHYYISTMIDPKSGEKYMLFNDNPWNMIEIGFPWGNKKLTAMADSMFWEHVRASVESDSIDEAYLAEVPIRFRSFVQTGGYHHCIIMDSW